MNNIGLEIAAALIAVHSNTGEKTVDAHIALYLEALSKLSAYPAPSIHINEDAARVLRDWLDRLVAKGGAA
jgi:hypothetical protein